MRAIGPRRPRRRARALLGFAKSVPAIAQYGLIEGIETSVIGYDGLSFAIHSEPLASVMHYRPVCRGYMWTAVRDSSTDDLF
jgi:hypothetical protein